MSIFSFLFGKKGENVIDESLPKKPPIYGGDGLTKTTPAIVNCASMVTAQALIDGFINDRVGDEWERVVEYSLKAWDGSDKAIRLVCVETPSGKEGKFYFDLSRPVKVFNKMAGL